MDPLSLAHPDLTVPDHLVLGSLLRDVEAVRAQTRPKSESGDEGYHSQSSQGGFHDQATGTSLSKPILGLWHTILLYMLM
jgi:hypothetical protein